ncbi:hypothetical protein E5206_09350 [Arthrobacter sp. PAMC25564]|uniref:hypothetical protein n=1 Tax=Arthrobacter sp. PAMC25564 TaxID=2565366 RepID=UPI0010A223FC|nr:hypothetical protein [Arthrobacter sp. PAMC25564]QCB97109.1 hypothetical protein E5206_09350 [Arthrobacter sp. PAMC25564]
MTDYPFALQIVVDPDNPMNVVKAGTVYLYDPSDLASVSPIAIKDLSGLPMTNPLKSNGIGATNPFIATIPKVKWKSGPYEGFFYSYDGLRNEAVAARAAAEAASGSAATAATNAAAVTTAAIAGAVATAGTEAAAAANASLSAAVASAGTAATSATSAATAAATSASAAAAAAALVAAPADAAIAAAINGAGTATKTALNDTYAPLGTLLIDGGNATSIYTNTFNLDGGSAAV